MRNPEIAKNPSTPTDIRIWRIHAGGTRPVFWKECRRITSVASANRIAFSVREFHVLFAYRLAPRCRRYRSGSLTRVVAFRLVSDRKNDRVGDLVDLDLQRPRLRVRPPPRG